MKCIVIVGSHNRNLCLLKELATIKKIKITQAYILKRENLLPPPPLNLENNLKKLWKLHFKKRQETEKDYFDFDNKFLNHIENIKYISSLNELNLEENLKFISSLEIDCCFIAGIPIIKKPLLDILPINTINLHLGLIPFYKGSITTFWPFYNLEPNMLGTTYHIIDKYVDTGEILHQNRPKLEINDTLHSASCKAVISAINDLNLIVEEMIYRINKNMMPKKDTKLRKIGNLYKKDDWKPEMLKKIYVDYKDNIVKMYLEKKIKPSRNIKLIKLIPR